MASTDNGSQTKSSATVKQDSFKQVIRQKVTAFLKSNFATTLATQPDIVNLVMSLIQRESGFNTAANSGPYGAAHQNKVLSYPSVKTKYSSASAQERSNIISSISARGLMQCTGYYILKDAGPSGKCELDRLRPDLSSTITVPIGSDVSSKLNGDSTIDAQLLAGLIILEDKYKNIAPSLVKNGTYSDRMTATLAAYLGLGASDKFGTTPQAYADSIIRGKTYAQANGGLGPDGKPLLAGGSTSGTNSGTTAAGPATTVASGNNLSMPGC